MIRAYLDPGLRYPISRDGTWMQPVEFTLGRAAPQKRTIYLHNNQAITARLNLVPPALDKFIITMPDVIHATPGVTPVTITILGDSANVPWVEDFTLRFTAIGNELPAGYTDTDFSDWDAFASGDALLGLEALRFEASAFLLPTGDERYGRSVNSHVRTQEAYERYIASGMGIYSDEYRAERVAFAAEHTYPYALWALNRQYLFNPEFAPMRHASRRAESIGYAPPGINQFPPKVRRRVLARAFEIVRKTGTAAGYRLAFEALGVNVAGAGITHDSLNFEWNIRLPVYSVGIFDIEYLGNYALYHTDAYNLVNLGLIDAPESITFSDIDYTVKPVPGPVIANRGRGILLPPAITGIVDAHTSFPPTLTVGSPAPGQEFQEASIAPELVVTSPTPGQEFFYSEETIGGVVYATLSFAPDTTTNMPNPERGWHGTPSTRAGFNAVRNAGQTTTRFLGRLDNFRNSAISNAWLNDHEQDFAAARAAGIKLILRYAYNYDWVNPDAPLARILEHISQLEPIWRANADTIASFQAGFIGAWGEWHSSQNGLTNADPTARNQVLRALLDALPQSISLNLRYPDTGHIEFFGNTTPVNPEERFTGTDRSRLGILNDSFLANQTDGGTFVMNRYTANYQFNPVTKTFWRNTSRYTANSGETVDLDWREGHREDGPSAIAEMEQFNWDTLNRDYSTRVINGWIASGHYDTISRRLGYRLHLESATLPTHAPAGTNVAITLRMSNTGFGKVYNPRPIDLHLIPAMGGPGHTIRLTGDARRRLPLGGETVDMTFGFTIPAGITGEFEWYVSMPDPSPRLANDPRYAVRLANPGIWSAVDGQHRLGSFTAGLPVGGPPQLSVTSPAAGEEFRVDVIPDTLGTAAAVTLPVEGSASAITTRPLHLTVSSPTEGQEFSGGVMPTTGTSAVDTLPVDGAAAGVNTNPSTPPGLSVTSPAEGEEFTINDPDPAPTPVAGTSSSVPPAVTGAAVATPATPAGTGTSSSVPPAVTGAAATSINYPPALTVTSPEQDEEFQEPSGGAYPPEAFVVTVTTTGNNVEFHIPFWANVDVQVDWGDGTTPTAHTVYGPSHLYVAPGDYTAVVTGSATVLGSTNGLAAPLAWRNNVTGIIQWGDFGLTNLMAMCMDATKVTLVPNNLPSGVSNLAQAFRRATSFNQDLSGWGTSQVTNFTRTFDGATSFNQSLGSWNISGATNMNNMLDNCGMSVENYDATLIGWASQPNAPQNVTLGAAGRRYSPASAAARDTLISTHGWTITGDAPE